MVQSGAIAMKAIMIAALLLLNACGLSPKRQLSEEKVIEIATKAISPESDWGYTVSARRTKRGEWLVLFEGNSKNVGDFAFVYLSSSGEVRKIEGGL